MKITTKTTITVIEATAEELRQGNTLADGFSRILRNVVNGVGNYSCAEEPEDVEDDKDVEEGEDDD